VRSCSHNLPAFLTSFDSVQLHCCRTQGEFHRTRTGPGLSVRISDELYHHDLADVHAARKCDTRRSPSVVTAAARSPLSHSKSPPETRAPSRQVPHVYIRYKENTTAYTSTTHLKAHQRNPAPFSACPLPAQTPTSQTCSQGRFLPSVT